ncbi:AAA family ATPase [Streptomyces sp. NPDC059474]|uniref:AAA family ATPase n=1 Tax=Streptomyces sp. NPDC059474 TaxID=3346846 RepID=UPI0036BCE3C8
MRLHRLAITAFGPFGATQTIDFDELSAAGLFLLHGPTGAGKTSVLDAVCYALYGQVPGARQGNGLSLRSDHAEPLTPTEVVLEFTVGERRLEITRRPEQPRPKKRGTGMTREKAQTLLREYAPAAAPAPASGSASGPGQWKALSRSHQEIGEEMGQLLGMSREQFCQVVLLPQGDFARFLRADEMARGKLLGKLFDTGRFAAVEERLAELRRAAEKRVATGDERLLALAHRMAQAAGRTTELDGHPLPEPTPGEPGLADAVLEWAAVARTGARERRDIALSAVRAAESAHDAAQRAAGATRERAELQRRHTEARRRADDLERQRPDHDRLRELLERARAADAVVPALDLRTAAVRDHRAAEATERQARARLTAEPGLAATALAETPDIPDQRTPPGRSTSPAVSLPPQIPASPEEATASAGAAAAAGAVPDEDPAADVRGRASLGDAGDSKPPRPTDAQSVRHGRTGTGALARVGGTAAQAGVAPGTPDQEPPAVAGAPGMPSQVPEAVSAAEEGASGVRATGRATASESGEPDEGLVDGQAGSGAGAAGGGGAVPDPASSGAAASSVPSQGPGSGEPGARGRAVPQAGPSDGETAVTEARGASLQASGPTSRGEGAAHPDAAGRFANSARHGGTAPGPGGAYGERDRWAGARGVDASAVLGGADAEWLGRVERRVREELGALGAARRREARAEAVVGEIGALDRETRADDEAIEEAAEWLAGWDGTHRAHQRRVEAAQEAVNRAEQLGGRIEPAERRLEAARRRDRLAGQERAAWDELLRAREGAAGARQNWLDLKEARLRGIAAELAAGLRAGEPCAVCGATEHPGPARPGAGHVDRTAEETALADHQRAEEVREEAERTRNALREAHAGAEATAEGEDAAELDRALAELRAAYAEARDAAADGHAARAALDRAEGEHARRTAQRQEAERRAAARTSRRETLARERAALLAELEQARGADATVAERAARLERQAGLLARAAEAVRGAEAAASRLKEADARLADAAYRAGFETPEQAAEAVLPPDRQREARRRLDAWQTESAAAAAELSDARVLAAAQAPPADPAAAQTAADAATRALREVSAADAAARTRCEDLDALSTQAVADARRLAPLRAEHDRIARLASLAAGTSTDNERRMRLEAYVLAARLEQVAAAASARLRHMSSGRYTLVHSDARSGGRGRSGLGLHVIDAWTGSERDTATLSGGETFSASLALALGLADVVTDEAGGVRLDTLFIDEGFGSLDEQTLEEVMDVLDSLRERDRTVGIVSHVADLRRRIPAQLEVVKGREGSAVRHRMAAAH